MTRNIPQCRHWRINLDSEKILWARLDRAGESVNALSREVLEELEALIDAAEKSPPRGLVLMSGKDTGFIYGADVKEFEGFDDAATVTDEVRRVHRMFDRLEKLRCPTVAAIDGYCLGGGLELALACDYRIARDVPATKLGFPEVQLGIFPGFGGSARSVHRIGGLKAMELMLSSRQISARVAAGMGLVDQLSGRHQALSWTARRAVLQRRRSRGPGLLGRLTNRLPARNLLAWQMRRTTRKRARPEHYPAPHRLIDIWERHGGNRRRMMRAEAKAIGELMVSPAAKGLRRVYSLMERLKSEGRQSNFDPRRIHVVGAGVMGGDIAAWCVTRGLDVSLQDRGQEYIEPALKRAEKLFRRKLKDPRKVKAALERIRPDVEGRHVPLADVIIEAIFEDAEAKQSLFRDIEPRMREDAILASNTSAIPLETLAQALDRPSRLVGLHFFNPVARMPLVEVVRGEHSDADVLSRAAAFCNRINRFPLPVRSSPGFLVNRVLAPYMMKALQMHLEGTPLEAIDAAAEMFGMPMGPVELADTVGLDVCVMVTGVLGGDTDTGNEEKRFIQQFVDAGNLGKKSGRGLYPWKKGKAVKSRSAGKGHDLRILSDRLIRAYTLECQSALDDGVVADEDLLDAGMVFGTGFAPFRGGPMYYLQHRDEQYRVPGLETTRSDTHNTQAES